MTSASVELTFDVATNSADAIQRAAYKFCDRLSIDLRRNGDVFVCALMIGDSERVPVEATVADFRVEVLDQVLRERIRTETEATRNVILALAFSKTDLASE